MRVILADVKSRSRIRQQGHRRRRLRVAARSVLARDRDHGLPQEAVPRRAQRAHGVHRGDPGARRPRREVDARRVWSTATSRWCSRRSSIQERNRLGRPDARARRQGRVHRHHGVEDAGAVRGSLRLHPERRARSGRHAPRAGRDSVRASSSASRSTTSTRCRFRAGISSPRTAAQIRHQVVVAAGWRRLSRCWRAAAARSSAPIARTGFWPATAPARSRTSSTRSSGCAISIRRPYVIFRDPLFTEQRERCLELCDEIQARGLTLTFEAETRLDRLDVELLDRLYAAGFRAMSFGVESLDPGHAEEVGPAADSGSPSARDHRALPQARHRHGGVLRPRLPAGRLALDRGHDRLRHRSGLDLRAVQDPDALSRHADVQAARAAAHRDRLGEVRRLHADIQAPEPDGARAASSCSARPTSASTCGRRTSRTS